MATIIKTGGPISIADGSSFNFDDMTDKANSYLDTIRQDAASIVGGARKEAEVIRRRAEEEGRQGAIRVAEKAMEEKVGKQLGLLIPALKQAVEGIGHARQAWLAHWEKCAVHLAARMAARVIRRELKSDPTITQTLVREALELAAGSTEMLIRLHPDDFTTLKSHADQLAAELSRNARVQVVADPGVTSGGCRVDTKFGVIDQQIDAQLERLEEELA